MADWNSTYDLTQRYGPKGWLGSSSQSEHTTDEALQKLIANAKAGGFVFIIKDEKPIAGPGKNDLTMDKKPSSFICILWLKLVS